MEPEQQAIPENMDDFISNAIDEATPEPEVAPEPELEAPAEPLEVAEAELEPAPEPESDEPNEIDEPVSDEPAEQTITAPQSMSKEDRESFEKLPPESQTWLTERVKQQEADYTRKTMELADQRKGHDRLEQVLAPRREQLAMDGMDDSTAIGQLFALSDFAQRDPVEFARYLFNQRGIPLSSLNEPGQTQTDPQMTAIQRELQGFKQTLHNQQQQQQDSDRASIMSGIEEFAQANPYYSELEQEMIPIISALRQSNPGATHTENLTKAYKMAMATNEAVSVKHGADLKAKAEVARIAKAKKDAAAAKKAAGTNVRSSGALPAAATKATDVGDFIGALVDERMTA